MQPPENITKKTDMKSIFPNQLSHMAFIPRFIKKRNQYALKIKEELWYKMKQF
jgi:hypothetical protein